MNENNNDDLINIIADPAFMVVVESLVDNGRTLGEEITPDIYCVALAAAAGTVFAQQIDNDVSEDEKERWTSFLNFVLTGYFLTNNNQAIGEPLQGSEPIPPSKQMNTAAKKQKISIKMCCGSMQVALESGTDAEGYGPVFWDHQDGNIKASSHPTAISYCPWCGKSVEPSGLREPTLASKS